MDRVKEQELFAQLTRMPRVREWLEEALDAQVKILMVNPSHEALLKAQGAAAMCKQVLDKLAAAETAARQR